MTNERFEYLDSVRGIACMIVFFGHVLIQCHPYLFPYADTKYSYENLWFYPPFGFLICGNAAVCLFFVLSGFVLSYRFLGSKEYGKIIESIIKRPARLAGVFFFTLAIGICVYHPTWDSFLVSFSGQFYPYIFALGKRFNGSLWTIEYEFYGSFLVFGLCLIMSNMNKKHRALLLIVCCLVFKNGYYFAFIAGILIADLYKNWHAGWFAKHKNTISWILLPVSIFFCSYPRFLDVNKRFMDDIEFIQSGYSMIGAIMMLIAIMSNIRINSVLNNKLCSFTGKISYSIYAVHFPLIILLSNVFPALSMLEFSAIIFPAVFIISYFTDKYIDKPCIHFSSWFAKGLIKEFQYFKTQYLIMIMPEPPEPPFPPVVPIYDAPPPPPPVFAIPLAPTKVE